MGGASEDKGLGWEGHPPEKRREAREPSMTSFIVCTLNTGRLGSIDWISRRICGSYWQITTLI